MNLDLCDLGLFTNLAMEVPLKVEGSRHLDLSLGVCSCEVVQFLWNLMVPPTPYIWFYFLFYYVWYKIMFKMICHWVKSTLRKLVRKHPRSERHYSVEWCSKISSPVLHPHISCRLSFLHGALIKHVCIPGALWVFAARYLQTLLWILRAHNLGGGVGSSQGELFPNHRAPLPSEDFASPFLDCISEHDTCKHMKSSSLNSHGPSPWNTLWSFQEE